MKVALRNAAFAASCLELSERGVDTSRMNGFCQSMWEELAKHWPEMITQVLRADILTVADTTFAAEALGVVATSDEVVELLLHLSTHPVPLVREGAAYGLGGHVGHKAVKEALPRLRANELCEVLHEVWDDLIKESQSE